ncbi:putative ATP-grasp protein [Xanthomonas phage DES1]|nr:putative ATP-grasp protein [Xanthomonas phage DES1]
MKKVMLFRGNRKTRGVFTLRAAMVAAGISTKVNKRGSMPRSRNSLVIGWGDSSNHHASDINYASAVCLAVNKLYTFQRLEAYNVAAPAYTEQLEEVGDSKWLARTNLTGSGGDGIIVVRPGDEIPEAPLYVKYIPKAQEYRIHVFNGKVIATQQKRKRSDVEQTPDQKLIRNSANGWVFCVEAVEFLNDDVEQDVKTQAVNAVEALGLDFAAVDIIVGRDDNKAYVLELNTAPGLESPTVIAAYIQAIKEILDE